MDDIQAEVDRLIGELFDWQSRERILVAYLRNRIDQYETLRLLETCGLSEVGRD